MKRPAWLTGALAIVALAGAWPAAGAGLEDFRLVKMIPADAMIAVLSRDHAKQDFVNAQSARVWEAIEKQGFGKDLKRIFRGLVQQEGGDVEFFDTQWQQITDLAAQVEWGTLAEREFAVALKVDVPAGADFVMLMIPPADRVAKDFDALAAILKDLVGLAPEGQLALTTEGSGDAVLHRLSVPNQVPPMGLTLARQKDVLLVGAGQQMVEQSLALLRGESEAKGALVASERFQQALKRLPPPTDSFYFVDTARLMGQVRQLVQMLAPLMEPPPSTQATDTAPSPTAFLLPLVNEFDVWDYFAGVASTDGMRTTSENVVVLRDEASSLMLRKALYGTPPIKDPLKFIPKDATGVWASSGIDLATLYRGALDFIEKKVPGGKELRTQWEQQQTELKFSVEEDLLSWLAGPMASFNATRSGSTYAPEWAWILDVKDEAKANAALEKLSTTLNEMLASQQGGVEDAKLADGPGFKRVILPPLFAMMPGFGRPVYGVKDGKLFIGSGPEVVTMALESGAGSRPNFSQNERFKKEGLPLPERATSMQFTDLSRLGEELSQAFAVTGIMQMFMPPEAAKDPMVVSVMSVLTKIGRVVKTLDYFSSSCSVTTFDGKVSVTKTVTNYQEPPKPEPTTQPTAAEAAPAKKT